MSKRVVLRPRAHRDILETYACLRADSPEAALRFRNAVERVVRMLGEHPGMGSARHAEICPELPHPLRFHPVTEFPRILVYYMERADVVEVVRIWDAARGLSELRVEEPRAVYEALLRANTPSAAPRGPA